MPHTLLRDVGRASIVYGSDSPFVNPLVTNMFGPPDPKYQTKPPRSAAEIPPGIIISPDTRRTERVPAGQSRTRKWPVLHYSNVPHVATAKWTFTLNGLVDQPRHWSWEEFRALPRVQVYADFHCVTRWSRLDNVWEGVSLRYLLKEVGVQPTAQFALPIAFDGGWTTNLPLSDLLQDDVLLADTHDGELLDPDHGGPVRLVVPRLYAWKSAKWIRGIELSAEDRPGLWEQGGYHDRGDPWTVSEDYPDGERFRLG